MSTHILFEHPLNEKMRTWLRIEFLIQQLSQHLPVNDHATALHFFRNVGDLLDVIERGDVRTELLNFTPAAEKQQHDPDGRAARWPVFTRGSSDCAGAPAPEHTGRML